MLPVLIGVLEIRMLNAAVVGLGINSLTQQPAFYLFCISLCKHIDDSSPLQSRYCFRQPGETTCLICKGNVLKGQAIANQRAAEHLNITQLINNICDDPIIGCGSCT